MKQILLLALFLMPLAVLAQNKPAPPSPLVVELFTSEGCSSCPPADALLAQLEKQGNFNGRPIIVLGEHVDYWNGLGWHDRFSAAAFTARQSEYARQLGVASVYTPQMIVNGRTELVGNDPDALQKAFTAAAPSTSDPVTLEVSRDNVAHISVTNAARGTHVFLAITETNLTTTVHGGENKNRELHHAGVVRQLRDLGAPNASLTVPLKLDAAWNRQNIRVIAFTQHGDAGPIESAASAPLP
jgi:hypothetical protein